jgi:chaperone required for assembly of F1-ATPase
MKRFWREVSVAQDESGWRVLLDGRGVKSVGGQPQVVPGRAMAEIMAAEWAAQGEEIDAGGFVLRDLADYAIDVVAPNPDEAVASLLLYAETDTLCYRADPEDALYRRQLELWEPLLTSTEARHGIRFVRVSGIVHRAQPDATLEHLRQILAGEGCFRLAALHTLAGLSASLVIGLAALDRDARAEALWAAANLEEDWQAELWGHDAEAETQRARRLAAFTAAMRFAQLALPD